MSDKIKYLEQLLKATTASVASELNEWLETSETKHSGGLVSLSLMNAAMNIKSASLGQPRDIVVRDSVSFLKQLPDSGLLDVALGNINVDLSTGRNYVDSPQLVVSEMQGIVDRAFSRLNTLDLENVMKGHMSIALFAVGAALFVKWRGVDRGADSANVLKALIGYLPQSRFHEIDVDALKKFD